MSVTTHAVSMAKLLVVVDVERLIARARGFFEPSAIEYRNFAPSIVNELSYLQ